MLKARLFPLVGVALVAIWQWATVHANYGGNWTALYCTGALQPHPPLVESEHIYIFPNSTGYDGQLYHYVAHDPFLRTGLKKFVDDPRLRYRRILIPGLAYALALGQQDWIDPAYELVFLLTVGLGVYWSCRFVEARGLAAAWGLCFLLIPAIPVAMDRLVIDGALAVFTIGVLYYADGPQWKLVLVLACAALTRETGFLLIAAALLFRPALTTALSAVPALCWYGFVQTQTGSSHYSFSLVPFSAMIQVLAHPWQYPPGTPFARVLVAADYLALSGILLALGLAFDLVWSKREVATIAAALFALLAVVVQREDHWQHVYDFGRIQSPLLVCLAGIAVRYRKLWLLAPVTMILPRLAMQFAPQIIGIYQKAAG